MYLFLLLLLGFKPIHCDWKTGSATFYGNKEYNGDQDDISDGTCACWKAWKYNICYNDWCFESIKDPKMIGAINTPGSENTAFCGICVELKCTTGRYRGLDWSEFGKDNVCYNNNPIIIQITDSCPEIHRNPTNKKYCNISHRHFDLSFWAFGKLADHKFGVIDINYKFVDCPPSDLLGTTSKHCCKERSGYTDPRFAKCVEGVNPNQCGW